MSGFMRMDQEVEWIYGINPIIEAIRADREIKEIYVSSGRKDKLDYILKEAEKRRIIVKIKDREFF